MDKIAQRLKAYIDTHPIDLGDSARESGPRAREARANPVLVRGKRARFRSSCTESTRDSALPPRLNSYVIF